MCLIIMLTRIRDISWSEVFDGWRKREAGNPAWIECATEVKGWPDWESWRSFTAQQFQAKERTWTLYRWNDPLSNIPDMLIGPFSGWQQRVIRKNDTTFSELLELPGEEERWRSHEGVRSILNGLPFATEMIGTVRKDNGKIVCIEGHHRAMAFSLARKEEGLLDFSQTPVTIALCVLEVEECALLDDALHRGTSKNPERKPTVVRLLKQTYLSMIRQSVGTRMFQHLYVSIDGVIKDATNSGILSCAFFASSILVLNGLMKSVHGTVEATVRDMEESGWVKITEPRIGAVVVWEKSLEGDGEHMRIGFVTGMHEAISNSSEEGVPIKHDLTFAGTRKVTDVFWHEKLSLF